MKFNDQSTLEELIEGCIRKDRLAQKYLYKQMYSSMFAVALRYSKDEDMATFILNNSFLKVFRFLHYEVKCDGGNVADHMA